MAPEYSAPYTPLLVGLYCLIACIATYQIVLIYCHGHKLLSFNFGFLWLCVLFCSWRVVFWLTDTLGDTLYHIMYWFPINIQFGMFYLVMLYIMRLVQRSEKNWNPRHKNLVFWISMGINATFFIATVGWVVFCQQLKNVQTNDSRQSTCDTTHAIFSAMCFLTLGLSLLFYGVKLHILATREAAALQNNKAADYQVPWGPNESRFRTEAICFTLLTVFISRAVFDLMQLELFNSHPLKISSEPNGKDITNPVVFWMYVAWEIFPTALMLFFFGTAVTASASVHQHSLQQRFVRERLTITENVGNHNPIDDSEDEGDIVEAGATNALWPLPKAVGDAAVRTVEKRLGDEKQLGLLDMDDHYDTPIDTYGFSSPLQLGAQEAQARAYAASMAGVSGSLAHPGYLGLPPSQLQGNASAAEGIGGAGFGST